MQVGRERKSPATASYFGSHKAVMKTPVSSLVVQNRDRCGERMNYAGVLLLIKLSRWPCRTFPTEVSLLKNNVSVNFAYCHF